MKKKVHLRHAVVFLNLAFACLFLILAINQNFPHVGHDYAYFIPHMLDTYLHHLVNGLSIQWFTPTFGGGLPSYANPQQVQFSPIQFLLFFFDPWKSIQIGLALYTSIGVLSFYTFAKRILGLSWESSILGAMFFILNGFYIGHMISGQMNFMSFPILSALVLVFFEKRITDVVAGIAASILISSVIYQAGFYIIIFFLMSLSMLFPLLYLIDSRIFSFFSLFKRILIAAFFSLLICASKLYAVYTLMSHFPRLVEFKYPAPSFTFINFICQLLGTMSLAPLMAIIGKGVNSVSLFLSSMTTSHFNSLWETDNCISPVLFCVLFLAGYQYLKSIKKITVPKLPRDQKMAWALFILSTWFCTEYTLQKGILYDFAKQLPILKSLHILFRSTTAFYFPFAIGGSLILNKWFKKLPQNKARKAYVLLNVLTVLMPLSYFFYTNDVHYRILDVQNQIDTYKQIKSGSRFPVKDIANEEITDWNALSKGVSTSVPYEPIFGYNLENFKPSIRPGHVLEIKNGYYNMTNPASITYPEAYGEKPFSLFSASDFTRLDQFIHRIQPDWHIPRNEIFINYISLFSFIFSVLLLFFKFMFFKKS